jgi:hypothetical protein
VIVFIMPLFLPLEWKKSVQKIGWGLYLTGLLSYFTAWVVLMQWPLSDIWSPVVWILAPYVAPLVFFTGIGLIGRSLLYVLLSVIFTFFHTLHGYYSFYFFEPEVLQRILGQ